MTKQVKQANQSIAIEINAKEGIFRTSKTVTFFYMHETNETMVQNMKAIMKEVKRLAKKSDITLTLSAMDVDYHETSVQRWCWSEWQYQGLHTIESRPFTGTDFSNINELKFVDIKGMYTYLQRELMKHVKNIMPNIPNDGDCFYSQNLNKPKTNELEVI